ncbi:hypothetical protein [Mesorhizobium sp. M0239]|uniref:hypothetical protein n=1 Tax=Mesorhizobium sp. M0239 TaxID=2956924 RepID=UPI003335CFA9
MRDLGSIRRSIWNWIQDWCALWVQPGASFVALISGTFLTFDFAQWEKANPAWAGPLEWISSLTVPIFLVSAALALGSGLIVTSRDGTIRRLRDKLAAQTGQIEEVGNVIVILFDGLLLNLANKLELEQGSQARLSLYVHDSEGRSFIRCGRYSRNPVFLSPGRTSYPDHQGCIAEGWKKGWHFDNALPAQGAQRRAYNLKTYAIPEAVTDSTRMKSTLYGVKRLDNLEGKAIAVLVVEAINADHFAEDALHATINGSINDYARVIHELRAYVPNPAKAAESGL